MSIDHGFSNPNQQAWQQAQSLEREAGDCSLLMVHGRRSKILCVHVVVWEGIATSCGARFVLKDDEFSGQRRIILN